MNGNVEEELTRPRPHSAGIWTLFSWLRKSDHSSSESISSVGSDRTAASFDFLAPLQYRNNNPPLILPSSPPTDTYKKRLHDRNVRRLHDRDTSIHRKYGLLKVDESRYDTYNLTSTSPQKSSCYKSQQGIRERRATSEYVHRRAAYVPGKRRAPQPPLPGTAATLPRSSKRKRPAPKPPTVIIESNKENFGINQFLRMSNKTSDDRDTHLKRNTSYVHKSDARKEPEQFKDKGFLKQIFVNRKRNSAIDTSHIKFLPSISELDKQAVEIIERNKALKVDETKCKNLIPNSQLPSENVWICTTCLRRYSSTVASCVYCIAGKRYTKRISMDVSNIQTQTDDNESVIKKRGDEREKLKEMLKEIKDSLPKRSKHEKNRRDTIISEPSTLRIGSNITETTKNHDLTLNSKKSSDAYVGTEFDKDQESNVTTISQQRTNFFNLQPPSSTTLNTAKVDKNLQPSSSHHVINTFIQPTNYFASHNVLININNNHLNSENNDKKPLEDNKVYGKGCSHTEILNKYMKSSETEKTITGTVSSDLLQEKEKASIVKKSAVHSKNLNSEIRNFSEITAKAESIKTPSDSKKCIPTHEPLKISSLLNPLYNPRQNSNEQNINLSEERKSSETALPLPGPTKLIALPKSFPTTSNSHNNTENSPLVGEQNDMFQVKVKHEVSLNPSLPTTASAGGEKITELRNPYSRRRFLISQLEQSISKGDEKTAADVAAKLAKLKLACSVLSFSSQIVADSVLMLQNNESLSNRRPDIIKDVGDPVNNNAMGKTDLVKSGTGNDCETMDKKNNDNSNNKNDRNVRTQENPSTSGLQTKETSGLQTKETSGLQTKETSGLNTKEKLVPIEVWIEDKETTRGPIRLRVLRESTMKELMQQAETSLGLAINLQRWIVGKTLCTDNNVSLSALAGPDLAFPFYLCLVESDIKNETLTAVKQDDSNHQNVAQAISNTKSDGVYTELIRLEREALVPNHEPFECVVCMENHAIGEGIVLRECLHIFCRECLTYTVRHCEEPVVSCPEVGCSDTLQEREVRALLSLEEYEKWLARSLAAAECGTRNTFHCRTKYCKGWAFCEPGVRKFPCPVCKCVNCVECQAVHAGETCKQFQEKLQKNVSAGENNQTDEGTKAFLNSLISRGEALECPECKTIITKKWGCDWVKCSACKTEICWVTRGRRWGPAGRGDISAGCRCGIDGQRCHPSCGYCH